MFFKAEGMKALVVDDNEVNAMVVSSMLEQFGIQVTEVYAGKDAILLEHREEFDIIFMDYLMPEMNGIEATEEIRKLGTVNRPVIIALSADVTPELKSRFEKAGVDDVIEKPLEIEAVYGILKKWAPEDTVSKKEFDISTDDQLLILREIFSGVQGLDVEKGLSHLANSAANYMKVLEAAVSNIYAEKNRLMVFSESMVQPSSMKICFHSLKGVFLNLGVSHLAEQSQMFELACINPQVDFSALNLKQYMEELDDFVKALENGLEQFDDNYVKASEERYIPISSEEYYRCKEELRYYLSYYEFNHLPELTSKLIYASKGEIRKQMCEIGKLIQNFQYEEALEKLDKIEK